jgi:DNA-binding transcriptional LysR family regulator
MTFDPRLALTFVSVAETLSFTRAAEQLGVAQPWISEQVRRLEDQLGFQLLERTSRRVELTDQGARFLDHARALAAANEAAQSFAKEVVAEASQTLRIGAIELLNDYAERTALIDRFVEANPTIQLQIHGGAAPDLIGRLKRGELDVVLAFTTSMGLADDLGVTVISQRIAHLLVPEEDPLARMDAIRMEALAGHTMISSPGRSDPLALRATFAAFVASGAEISPAPEAQRTTIEHYARVRRLICLRWSSVRLERHMVGDMVCVPIADTPPTIRFAILHPHGPVRRVTERFCAVGRAIAADAAHIMG